MQVRRVVTGHDANGKSVFASDEMVDAIHMSLAPGLEFHRLWGGDTRPTYPDSGAPLPGHAYFPPADGFRFIVFTTPPSTAAAPVQVADPAAAFAEAEERMPGLLGHMEPDNPGFHRTDTVDMLYVVSGQIVLALDDGAEVTLNAGDTIVQSGTRHAWRNPGTEPCVIVGVIVGANRSG
jgi:mannose-6-phosphate isomerase-like protein (cupin superfamily)